MLFYSNNFELFPAKPKLSFRYLKQGIQEFHRKYVLAPADKAANNVVVVWRPYALNPLVVYSTDRSKSVVPVLVLLFGALWFILRGDLLYVLPCVILFLCFSVLLALQLPRLGKRELILMPFVCLIDLCLFGFVGFLFLLMSGSAAVYDCYTPWTFLLAFFYYINTLIQELGSTKTYERISTDERPIVIPILSILLLNLQLVLKKSKTYFLRYIGYRNLINDLIKHVSLVLLVHVRLLFRPKY